MRKCNIDDDKNKKVINVDPFCHDVDEMINLTKKYDNGMYRENGFILGRISRLIYDNYFDDDEFKRLVIKSVKETRFENIRDTVVEFKTIKSGIQEGLFLHRRDGEIVEYRDVSNTTKNLKIQRDYIQPFFIYINIDSINEINLQKYRKIIGEKIGENIISSLEELLQQWV